MRKLRLQMQVSIDGFVAGPNGELDWMTWEHGDKMIEQINELTDNSDTIVMGRKMTDGFINYWSSVLEDPDSPEYSFAKKMIDIPKVVFTQTMTKSPWINTTLAHDLTTDIQKLKQQDGKDIIAYGGAGFVTNRQPLPKGIVVQVGKLYSNKTKRRDYDKSKSIHQL